MISLSKGYKLKALVALGMTYLITFLDRNIQSAVYVRVNINVLYYYFKMIVSQNTFNN